MSQNEVRHPPPEKELNFDVKMVSINVAVCYNPLTPTVAIWVQRERQSARMSKITNAGLNQSGTGCFIAVPIWQQWASNG